MARRKKSQTKKLEPSDLGSEYRGQHDEMELEETPVAGVRRARVFNDPLDRYYRRGEITYRQYDAAERFQAAWHIGCCGRAVTANYDVRIPSSSSDSVDDHVSRARQSVRSAIDAVGPLGSVLVHCAGLCLPAAEWAVMFDHSRRSGITVLRIALEALADYYRI